MSARRLKPGRVIRTVPGAVRMIVSRRWLFVRFGASGPPKPMHPSFLASWPIALLALFVRGSRVFAALPVNRFDTATVPERPREEAPDVPAR